MLRIAHSLDFAPLLLAIRRQLHEATDSPTDAPPCLKPRSPRVDFAAIDQRITELGRIYAPIKGVIGSFKIIGRARQDAGKIVHTTDQPWEFQGWLPFASRNVAQLAGGFVEIEMEVLDGEVHVSLLADDGETLVGDRRTLRTGSHQFQLRIPSNEIKGVVFSTGPRRPATSQFRLAQISVLRLDPESGAAAAWRDALALSTQRPPVEKSRFSEIETTAGMAIHRLIGQGEYLPARMLLHAAASSGAIIGDWFSERLADQLSDFLGNVTRPESPDSPDPELSASTVNASALRDWREVLAMREVFADMGLCPLHYEILELVLFLDLQATVGDWPLSIEWHRTALATTPVKRSLLRQLFEVITRRVGSDSKEGISVRIETSTAGTRLEVRSDLRNGDLQYRDFSNEVAELQRSLNSEQCAPPHLVHILGEENQLAIEWPDSCPADDASTRSWNSETSPPLQLIHDGTTGGKTWKRGDRCYKTAPHDHSKHNTLDQEARLILSQPDLEFLPKVAAASSSAQSSAMSYAFVQGQTLMAWSKTDPDESAVVWLLQSLSDAVSRLNQRGVEHRDLRAENVFVRDDLSISLIDFDQAESTDSADDFGNEWDTERVCAGFGGLIRQLGWEDIYLRAAGRLGLAWELGRQSAANSPGKHACYYRWQWGPLALSGERPWTERWQLLQHAFSGRSGRFLEFGCNLGLLSTYAAQRGWSSLGLDHDEVAVAGAETIAATLGADAQFRTADITSPAAFTPLTETYDMVSALSVVHWLSDPGPIEDFLRRQPRLLFEGHRSFADERDYLHSLDFPVVELLGYSERLRPVLIASQ